MTPEQAPNLKAFRDFEEAGWNRNAADYAGAFARATDHFIDPLLDAAGVTSATRLLDLACGPGNLSATAATRGADVVGVDIAQKMIAVARQRNPGIPFQRASADDLPFDEGTFDAVCASFAMHHFPDPRDAALEVFRVLRPSGAFSFTIWSGDADKDPFFEIVQQAVRKHGTLDAALPDGPNAFVLAQEGKCEAVLSDAGFGGFQRWEITVEVDLDRPEGILDIVATTVRMRSIVEAQTEEAQRVIRDDIIEGARAFERDGMVRLPMTGVLFSTRRGE